jgi:kynurenine formamidase
MATERRTNVPVSEAASNEAADHDLAELRERIGMMAGRVSNWGRWGSDDELGTINYITEASRRAAVGTVREGRVLSLALPFDRAGPQPPFERRLNPSLTMLRAGTDLCASGRTDPEGWGYAVDMMTMALQCGTQWDALSHAFYDFHMYNDRDCRLVTADGAQKNAISVLRDRVVGRGVLLDIARLRGIEVLPAGYEVTAADLEAAYTAAGIESVPGDILLIRTGHLGRFRATGSWHGFTHAAEPGIGLDTLQWLHDRQVGAVATDTWAVEVIRDRAGGGPNPIYLPVHAVAIVHMGLLLGEIFDLDALAEDCARDGVCAFLFSGAPLPFTGAVGSPVNPVVVK